MEQIACAKALRPKQGVYFKTIRRLKWLDGVTRRFREVKQVSW